MSKVTAGTVATVISCGVEITVNRTIRLVFLLLAISIRTIVET